MQEVDHERPFVFILRTPQSERVLQSFNRDTLDTLRYALVAKRAEALSL